MEEGGGRMGYVQEGYAGGAQRMVRLMTGSMKALTYRIRGVRDDMGARGEGWRGGWRYEGEGMRV